MRTPTDSQRAMFGCHPDDFVEWALQYPNVEWSGLGMVMLSELSDAQHHIARGNADAARKAINRAKLLLDRCRVDRSLPFYRDSEPYRPPCESDDVDGTPNTSRG